MVMRQVAWTLAVLPLLVLLQVDPASASCSVVEEPVRLDVCTDSHGNGTPDQVYLETPVGTLRYSEPDCFPCAQPSTVTVHLDAAGQQVHAVVVCYTVAGQANARCVSAELTAGSDLAGAHARTSTGPGPNTWACGQSHTYFMVIFVACQRVPHPVHLPG